MITCYARKIGDTDYSEASKAGIRFEMKEVSKNSLGTVCQVELTNECGTDFSGVIHIKLEKKVSDPKFFMPGYMYNRNTADMPSSGRKAFPRIKVGGIRMPESEFFMTRSDRLAEPVSLIYGSQRVYGICAAPVICNQEDGSFLQFTGFSCNICEPGNTCDTEKGSDDMHVSVGYTLGYENAPWLFVQTANVLPREDLSAKNAFVLKAREKYSCDVMIYDYPAEDERSVYEAIKDAYERFHEKPRSILGMDTHKALKMLTEAIRDYAWIPKKGQYTGFVYDRPEGLGYNYIPSITWTNGLSVAVPVLLAAAKLGDEKARGQSISFVDYVVKNFLNPASGFLYESEINGKPTVRGWWYDGMHSGGHSSYLNGQAVYYILKAYVSEQSNGTEHSEWLDLAGKVVKRMQDVINADYEYPFSMSEKTGVGLEYDSMGGAWFLAASALYTQVTGKQDYLSLLLKSEQHYYDVFVKKMECYGGPLDTDKAVDSEGVLAYIRATRILHEVTGETYLLDHLRDALYYEFTFKLGYNTHIEVRPLSEIGWSSCGGSITSVANPHIHPMSSTVVGEMGYYLKYREDEHMRSRMNDTVGWSLQTFNTRDKEYGYGKPGWMSERFCYCQGLLTEHYPDGEVASTWFALMAWAVGSIIEGLVSEN